MLTVSKLAETAGVNPHTIRYYEKQRLLPEPDRTDSGYRSYEPEMVDRVRFIKGAQRFGLKLRDIRDLLEIRDRGMCPCGHTGDLVRRRVSEVDAEIERLTLLRSELLNMAKRYPNECDKPSDTRWPCEVEFIEAGR